MKLSLLFCYRNVALQSCQCIIKNYNDGLTAMVLRCYIEPHRCDMKTKDDFLPRTQDKTGIEFIRY